MEHDPHACKTEGNKDAPQLRTKWGMTDDCCRSWGKETVPKAGGVRRRRPCRNAGRAGRAGARKSRKVKSRERTMNPVCSEHGEEAGLVPPTGRI